jgi:predicted HTH transcriptional regulator
MNQKVVVYNENYITNLLATKAEENTYLEFKRADSLIIHPDNKSKNLEEIKNEIAKDVSAFANSDGGVLIYGIAEENHVATDYSFIDGNIFTKETLEQIINSRIHRKIEGFHIEPIRFNNDIEKTIYVIEIPRSINVPHQTKDKKFYIEKKFLRRLKNWKNLRLENYITERI